MYKLLKFFLLSFTLLGATYCSVTSSTPKVEKSPLLTVEITTTADDGKKYTFTNTNKGKNYTTDHYDRNGSMTGISSNNLIDATDHVNLIHTKFTLTNTDPTVDHYRLFYQWYGHNPGDSGCTSPHADRVTAGQGVTQILNASNEYTVEEDHNFDNYCGRIKTKGDEFGIISLTAVDKDGKETEFTGYKSGFLGFSVGGEAIWGTQTIS